MEQTVRHGTYGISWHGPVSVVYVKQCDIVVMASFGMDHLFVNVKQCDMGDFFYL